MDLKTQIMEWMPIVSTHLEERYGFTCKVDYDKDFATDEYYSLKTNTYKKQLTGTMQLHVTDSFRFVAAPDEWEYRNTMVELNNGTEYTTLNIDKMWQLLMLIDLLKAPCPEGV